jgi:hypothetical protein
MKKFKGLNKETIQLIQEFLDELRKKTIGYEEARNLTKTIKAANALPEVPKQNLVISFQCNDTQFYVVITDYKIELSDLFRDFDESYSRFNFRYELSGDHIEEGNLDEFRSLLFDCLRDVSVTDISFSEEE